MSGIDDMLRALCCLRWYAKLRLRSSRYQLEAPLVSFGSFAHFPIVIEIRGRSNEELAPDISHQVLRWVAASSGILRRPLVDQSKAQTDADDIFAQLIEPYVSTHQEALASYGPVTLQSFESDLSELAKRLGITSWPVRYERRPGI